MIKDIDYRYFLQDHLPYNEREAWTADQFPDADYRYFHEAGCLVCSLAYLLRYHEIEKENNTDIFNPWTFCERLIQIKNAFSSAADLKISSVSKLYPIGYLGAVKFSKEDLLDYVNQGYLCLIVVKGMNGPVHFLALEEWKENDAIVFDPKKGRRSLSEYTEIYQIRLFRRTNRIKTGYEIIYDRNRDRTSGIKTGKIAICFDDGPSETHTEKVLNVLKENNIKATFFLLGNLIRKYEADVRRIANDGHQIGIHGWDHFYMNAMSEEECLYSLNRTEEEIRCVCGVTPTIFRPPGGYADDSVLKTAKDLGLAVIGWSVDSRDWCYGRNAQMIVESVLSEVSAGDIILMHDIYSTTAEALEIIIKEVKERGLIPVTVDELFAEINGLEPGRIYNFYEKE